MLPTETAVANPCTCGHFSQVFFCSDIGTGSHTQNNRLALAVTRQAGWL